MARRRTVKKSEVRPDPYYNDPVIAKFINCLMMDGKKSVAERIFNKALLYVSQKIAGQEAFSVFHQALAALRPSVEVRSRRIGGATYPVPIEVRYERAQALSWRWLIKAARKRPEKTMCERLAREILDAYSQKGEAVRKREELHKMAAANKAFSHYRW